MKKIIIALLTLFLFILPINIKADESIIIDESGVLSQQEINDLYQYLNNKSQDLDINMVVLFSNTQTDDIEKHARDYFYSLGYQNGVIYELNFAVREYIIVYVNNSSNINNELSVLEENMYPSIKEEDYYNSIKIYCDGIYDIYHEEIYEEDYSSNDIIEYNNKDAIKEKILSALIPSLIISAIIVLVTMLKLFNQLKTVKKRKDANGYQDNSSFKLSRSGDLYLYTTTTRVKVNNNTNNSNSSFHSSHGSFSGSGGSHKF